MVVFFQKLVEVLELVFFFFFPHWPIGSSCCVSRGGTTRSKVCLSEVCVLKGLTVSVHKPHPVDTSLSHLSPTHSSLEGGLTWIHTDIGLTQLFETVQGVSSQFHQAQRKVEPLPSHA